MKKKIKRLAGIGAADWRLVPEVLWLVWRLEGTLRFSAPSALARHCARLSVLPARPASKAPLPAPGVLNDLISLVYRLLGLRPSCLRRSLILKELFWRRGERSRLVIGVARRGDRLESHAWVEGGISSLRTAWGEPTPFQGLLIL